MIIAIQPITELKLNHWAYPIAISASGHIAAVSRNGGGCILPPDCASSRSFPLPAEATDVSLSADGSLLAVVLRGTMLLVSTSTLKPIHRISDPIETCLFASTGELWSASTSDDRSILLEVREPETWQVIARTEVPDPFGNSDLKILPHPDRDHVALHVAGGQDGQRLYWARRHASTLSAKPFAGLDETTFPSFSRSGDQFLVCNLQELRQYQFPQGPLLARMPWPFDDMDNQIGDEVLFLDPTRALLPSTGDKLYLVDLTTMTIAGEITFPVLHGNTRLYPLPDGRILSAHRTGPTDTILTWRLP